jgi:hypothetical protein
MPTLDVPTGDSTQTVQAYYDHLYSHYLAQAFDQSWLLEWGNLLWVLLWLSALTAVFFAYSYWQRTTRAPKEPYPLESYDGHIQEMNGPVGPFLTLFFIGVALWLGLFTILKIMNGQVY